MTLRDQKNGPWCDDETEPPVTVENTDGSASGPFGGPPWTVRASNYTDHSLFARIIQEWNLSTVWAKNAIFGNDSKYRERRRADLQHYLDHVLEKAEEKAK